MIINVSKIKTKLSSSTLMLIPIIIGLIPNILYSLDSSKVLGHLVIFLIFLPWTMGTIGSLKVFQGNRKWINYYYGIFHTIYLEFVFLQTSFMNNEKYHSLSFPMIILYLLMPYGIYLFIAAALALYKNISRKFWSWLRKRNIYIITNKSRRKIGNKSYELNLDSELNLENRFGEFEKDITSLNEHIIKRSELLLAKLKMFQRDSKILSNKLSEDKVNLDNVTSELHKLNKIKNISEEEIDALLSHQNKNQIKSIFIGFIFGVISSIIASFVYDLIKISF